MANWNKNPPFVDIENINTNNKFEVADGITYRDMNTIVENLQNLKNTVGQSVDSLIKLNALTEAKLNENIIKDPSKTYLVWKGDKFPNSTDATFKASEGCTIDWGDGNVETFETTSTEVSTHNYTDGIEYHLISISNRILINDKEFKNCVGLICLELSDKVKYIRNSAFNGCKFLTSITLHNGLVGIGNSAFFNCRSLTSITIPDSVKNIDRSAFSSCLSLKTIKILATNPPTIEPAVFAVGSDDKIIVPKSAINAYKTAAGWIAYADKIVYEVDSSDLGNVEVDNRTITKTPNEEIQAVALTNGTDLLTYAEILQATTIERL